MLIVNKPMDLKIKIRKQLKRSKETVSKKQEESNRKDFMGKLQTALRLKICNEINTQDTQNAFEGSMLTKLKNLGQTMREEAKLSEGLRSKPKSDQSQNFSNTGISF